ncbi:unknown protein [Seminavis robusta]|uniref:RING-type domain-containing protein n=1 Tax=Seminavis robusta TaxID=568900 RepID=A0A9N8DW11_9STRA|nr:unknown protein [Seminavis robusta]|eukprot:Sro386_g131940.1 n/a (218) ;mRNA; r:48970-49710
MSSSSSFDETNIVVHLHHPEEHKLPSVRFDMITFVGVMVCVVIASAILVASIIWCSRKQEKAAAKLKEAKKQKSLDILKGNLDCKPWCPNDDYDATESSDEMTSSPSCRSSIACLESSVSSSSSLESVNVEDDEEMQMQVVTMNGDELDINQTPSLKHHQDSSCCPICNEKYQVGQPVYESNNPQCGHQAHKVCMEKRLERRNSCPLCVQPFVLRTV